ncbi:hypothetical protein BD310DRAFT_918636 [Dichomitus squalens]|uniref:F-box domain-containing protein n=1 Tax=Dichomitus squalens TaxID=114155 RepID=A0A4Q9Q5I0_9APHY|nr:hypothetical protein BD310DRAFT_918636 [Dichomitus squalens]
MISTIPFDVACTITDHLDGDLTSLASCTLLCSTWLLASRRHLFRKLDVWSNLEDGSFATFDEFLKGSRHVAEYIQELYLGWDRRLWKQSEAPLAYPLRGKKPARISLRRLHCIVQQLPLLRKLVFDEVGYTTDGFVVPSFPARPAIDNLEINTPHFRADRDDPLDVLRVLGIFSEIGVVSLSAWWEGALTVKPEVLMRDFVYPGPVEIHDLKTHHISSSWLSLVSCAILKTGSLRKGGTLKTLTLHLDSSQWDEIAVVVGWLLREAGQNLRFIRLDPLSLLEDHDGSNRLWGRSNFSCTALVSLVLNLDYSCYTRNELGIRLGKELGFRIYQELLANDCPPFLERITFRVKLYKELEDRDDLFSMPWNTMEEVLLNSGTLKEVVIDFSTGSYDGREKFCEMMPTLDKKGMLTFRYHEVGDAKSSYWWDLPF